MCGGSKGLSGVDSVCKLEFGIFLSNDRSYIEWAWNPAVASPHHGGRLQESGIIKYLARRGIPIANNNKMLQDSKSMRFLECSVLSLWKSRSPQHNSALVRKVVTHGAPGRGNTRW